MKNKIVFLILIFVIVLFNFSCSKSNKKIELSNEDVANLYLISYDGKSESEYFVRSLGHTFMMIENITDSDLEIYNYVIKAHESITFSWWAIDKHMGIWFNIESSYIHLYNRYDDRFSINQYISYKDIENINNYMAKNDTYTPLDNCAKRCIELWNICALETEKVNKALINNPTSVCFEIKKCEYYQYNVNVPFIKEIYFYDEDKLVKYEME